MKPDSGRKSFFSAGKPKNLPAFYFLVVAGIILMVLLFKWFILFFISILDFLRSIFGFLTSILGFYLVVLAIN